MHRSSFRFKLIVSFMMVSLLPVIAVQLISYYISSEAMHKKIDVLVHANLLQTSKNLDTSMLAYEDIVNQIATNDEVVRLLKEINREEEDFELSRRKLINILAGYAYAKAGIRSVAVFTSDGGGSISYDRQNGSPYDNLWSNRVIRDEPVFRNAMTRSLTLITEPEQVDSIYHEERYAFHLARKITDYNSLSLEGIGVVVVTVNESVLADAINLADGMPIQTVSIDNYNYLANSEGIIVSAAEKEIIGRNVEGIVKKSTIVNTYINDTSGLLLYNLVDQNELFQEMYAMRRLSIVSGCLALLVSSLLILYFSGRLTASIRNVVRAMKMAQHGALHVQISNPDSRDEISHIAHSFNKMMTTITELLMETKQAVEKQKEAEIRALEAQINPHFLYNTLDSINWLAIEKEEHQISQMLKGLAQILRYSLKNSTKWVPLSEELKWMDKYTYLQQFRFRSSFRCEIHCPDELLHHIVPKLLLQPIIENAILHGFEGVKQGGLLKIDIAQPHPSMLAVSVADNGKGMSEDRLNEVVSGATGIGLSNVRERMSIYYGAKADMQINSQPGEGVQVVLLLPITAHTEVSI